MTADEIMDRISWLEYQIDRETCNDFYCDEAKLLNMENEIGYLNWLLEQTDTSGVE